MRWLLAVMLLTVPVTAGDCVRGSADAVTLKSWSVEAQKTLLGEASRVRYVLTNNQRKAIRMWDAGVHYEDVLGQRMTGYKLDPDIAASSNADFELVATYPGMDRLLKARAEDIVVTICTYAVVYSDGTKETFE